MAFKMDYFRGTESQVLANLGNRIKYPAFAIVRDTEESNTCRLAFVNQNNELEYIRGLNGTDSGEASVDKQIIQGNKLPDVSEARLDALYIVGESVYLFNGTAYKCINEMDTSELEALTNRVSVLEAAIATKVSADEVDAKVDAKVEEVVNTVVDEKVDEKVETKVAEAKEEILVSVDEKVEATVDEKVEAKVEEKVESVVDSKIEEAVTEAVEKSVEKIDYEISHKPEGTLVNKHDKEIRVMCPVDTAWSLQQSGTNADANKYYIGFKAYAPSDDVVSFKEDLAEIIADGTMYYFEGNDFAGVDENGRKYSIVWLPVAVYADGVWTYYGANSTEEKYIGWYYSVEWYNADGKIIASDCIRVNLSNEECHSRIEPFYLHNVTSEVKEDISSIKEDNEKLTAQVKELEEAIATLENESPSFIELE